MLWNANCSLVTYKEIDLKNFYSILYFLIVALFSLDASATHLVGGSMSYEYLGLQNNGNYRYRVTVQMYRDCEASSVPFDQEIDIGIYNNNSNKTLAKILTLPKITEIPVDPPSGGSDCSFQPNVCIRQGIYQGLVDLPSSTLGYHMVFRRCCRNTQQNIIDDMGQTYYAYIPNTAINNSSPYFTQVPAPYICRNDLTNVYNTAKDKDGDSLVYELSTPWTGGGKDEPVPELPFNFPAIPNFDKVIYRSNFNVNNPFGNSGIASIDSRNGVTNLLSPGLGRYSIAIDVSEYRNGVLISKIRLDIQMIVIDCPPNAIPEINTSTNSTSFTVTEGEKICFDVIASDADNDNIKLKGTGEIFAGMNGSQASFTEKSGTGSVSSEFCWTPPCGSARITPYPATFEVTDDGCPSKRKLININITVLPFIGASQITGPSPLCADQNGVTYSTSGLAGSSFEWAVTGGTIASGQGTNTITVDWDNGSFGTVKVKEINTGGCVGQEVNKNITLLPAPNKPNIIGPDSVCSFSGGSAYSITPTAGNTYTWSISGGAINSGAGTETVQTSWNTPGKGFLRVFQTNSAGCPSDPDTMWVTIIENKIDSLLGSPSVCPNSVEIDYMVQSPDPSATYTWTVDKGTQVAGGNSGAIKVNWGDIAVGYVEVFETNKFGCVSDPVRMVVDINHNLKGMVPLLEDTLCEFTSGIVYEVINTNGSTYFWELYGGNFQQNDSGAQVIVDWGPTGIATISVYETAYDSVNNKTCKSDPETLYVYLAPIPVSKAILGPDEICQGSDSILYNHVGFDRSTYLWTYDGGNFTGQGNDSIYIFPTQEGTFTITNIETSEFGCVGPMNSKSVVVHPRPRTVGIDGDPVICYPRFDQVLYGVLGFPTSIYNWSFDGGNISSGQGTQQAVLDFNGQQISQIEVQEISDFGCPGDTLRLEVFADNPSIDIKLISVVVGDDSKIEVEWELLNAPRYNQNFIVQRRTVNTPWQAAGTTNLGTEFFVDAGLNTDENNYEYRVLGFNLCGDSIFSEVHRHVQITGKKPENDPYAVQLNWSRYMGWDDGVNSYELYRSAGAEDFVMQNNTGLDTSDFYDDGTKTYRHCYRVKATENSTGAVSWSNEICFGFDPLLFVPNAFTPNGDGKNDQYTWSYASIKTFSIDIYDRWGALIYSADDPEKFWDGFYKGKEVPDGVYIFIINYTGFDGRLNLVKGNITLLR